MRYRVLFTVFLLFYLNFNILKAEPNSGLSTATI